MIEDKLAILLPSSFKSMDGQQRALRAQEKLPQLENAFNDLR